MVNYYLIKVQNEHFQCGTLVKYDKTYTQISDDNRSEFLNCDVTSSWIELTFMKMKYLLSRDALKRIEIHNNQLFEKFEQLKPNDKCYIIDWIKKVKCTILKDMNKDFKFVVQTEGDEQRTVSILAIDSIVDIQYYICHSKSKGIPDGAMFVREDDETTTYPENEKTTTKVDKMTKVSRDEAIYLCKYELKDRMELYRNKCWERVSKLTIGDKCYSRTNVDSGLLTIIGKEETNGHLIYTLESCDGKVVAVEQEDIYLAKLIRQKAKNNGSTLSVAVSIDQQKIKKERPSLRDAIKDLKEKQRKRKTIFFELSVICPHSVESIEVVRSREWDIDCRVQFRLGESYKKYTGTLKWVGLINKTNCAVVRVDGIDSTDHLGDHVCPKEVTERLNISMLDNLVIVLLATVSQENNPDVKSLLGYIMDCDTNGIILMEMIKNKDFSALKLIINRWKHPIYLADCPDLLTTLISQGRYDVIGILLDNFIATSEHDQAMLTIAKTFFLLNNYQNCLIAIKKCTDVNTHLANGEGFLTCVIKECDEEDRINTIIGQSIFDVNNPNEEEDTPLVLACRKLMVSTVRLLLSNDASVSYHDNMALNTVINLRNDNTCGMKWKQALEIIDLLTKDSKIDNNVCKICMDRKINFVFQCGHSICGICSEKILSCPSCSEIITDRRRIFLN